MDRVSIVIVSYNVRYFLRQCLQSIAKSVTGAQLETIVVDNDSRDGTVEMLEDDFPEVRLVRNRDNLGFSKANNQGFQLASGSYILVLNPDTIIQEDTIECCLQYLKSHPDAGAAGVAMVDGSGRYLPESKRAFPDPLSSLFKLTGLSRLFPRSPLFNAYYLGHLDRNSPHEVDVLSGAFIFTRRSIINETGGFDEDYFMYGEDIELCAQIRNKGYKIIYLPDSRIIHFKGESTNKNTIDYLRRFYGAMQTYSAKRSRFAGWQWKCILNAGIFLAGLVALVKNLTRFLIWPAINILVLFLVAKLIQKLWAIFYFKDPSYYDQASADWSLAVLILGLVACYYIFGQYDKVYRKKQWLYAAFFSGLGILALYGLFPMEWRFSRTVLLFLVLVSPFIMYAFRLVHNKAVRGIFSFDTNTDKRILLVGQASSAGKLSSIIEHYYRNPDIRIFEMRSSQPLLGQGMSDVVSMCEAYGCNEMIFCSSDMDTSEIFTLISRLENRGVQFKIANNDNTGILGSPSKNTLGEWFTEDIGFKLSQAFHRRSKRLLDIAFSAIAVVLLPLVLLLSNQRNKIYINLFAVMINRKTWIGFTTGESRLSGLPGLKTGVFSCVALMENISADKARLFYARYYTVWSEMEYLFRLFFSPGLKKL